MLRHARHFERFELRARDGRIGHVVDFLFDDRLWQVRYLVVDTGGWLNHRNVVIAPAAMHSPDWNERVIPVDLTRDQVRGSPSVEAEGPLSREQEVALAQYYSWPTYWASAGLPDALMYTPPATVLPASLHPLRGGAVVTDTQHHLRSMAEVRGYRLEANDGNIGRVEEFTVDDDSWAIAYLVIDTGTRWQGRRVLMAPEWIFEVGWEEAKVFVDVGRDDVSTSPTFDPSLPVTSDYVDLLHAHYGHPHRASEP